MNMARNTNLIKKDDLIEINYFLENLDNNENFLKENVVVKVSSLDLALQKEIINSVIGFWFSINYDKVEEEKLLKLNTSKFKDLELNSFILLEVKNEDNHKVVGKLVKKTTKYSIFDLKTPFEDNNWKVSVEILDILQNKKT